MDAGTELLRHSRTHAMPLSGTHTLRGVLRSHCLDETFAGVAEPNPASLLPHLEASQRGISIRPTEKCR